MASPIRASLAKTLWHSLHFPTVPFLGLFTLRSIPWLSNFSQLCSMSHVVDRLQQLPYQLDSGRVGPVGEWALAWDWGGRGRSWDISPPPTASGRSPEGAASSPWLQSLLRNLGPLRFQILPGDAGLWSWLLHICLLSLSAKGNSGLPPCLSAGYVTVHVWLLCSSIPCVNKSLHQIYSF